MNASAVERDGGAAESVPDHKRTLRSHFRALRCDIDDVANRSASMWACIRELDEYQAAVSVLMFDSIRGEPDTSLWQRAATDAGKQVWVPEARDLPAAVDLVIVPGVAFSFDGQRLGQGGGWYDRYLANLPAASATVGVCFAVQLAEALPTEPHDRRVDRVVTEDGIIEHRR